MTHPATNLRAAAAYLDQHGWTQGSYKRADGAVCVSRAILVTGESLHARRALAEAIGTWAIHAWNDAPGRTLDEVKAALLGAAEAFEREHPEWPR